MQTDHRADDHRHGKAQPHGAAAKKGPDEATARVLLDHGQIQLHYRIDQALLLDPLPPQHDHQTNHGHVQRHDQGQPAQNGLEPDLPGNVGGFAPGAFEKGANRAVVVRYYPGGDVGGNLVEPVVFRGGKIERGRYQRHPVKSDHGDRIGQAHKDEDDHQFALAEGPGAFYCPQKYIYKADQQKQDDMGYLAGEISVGIGAL